MCTRSPVPADELRVLVVSQYYPPEPGATQNRLGAFVDGLVGRGHRLTVLCEQPNHPAGVFQDGYGRRPMVTERSDGLTVHRLWVATSPRKTTLRRLGFYGTFAIGAGAGALARAHDHDVAFATSPPMPGALATGLASAARSLPFVLDVRDLWPAAAEALGELSSAAMIRQAERAERWLYRRAARVTATTQPFCAHIDRVAGRSVSEHLPNGALDSLLELPDPGRPESGRFIVGYAGNLGIAQGLEVILDAAERLRGEDVGFVLVGDGPMSEPLRLERERRGLESVEFRHAVPASGVGEFLLSCDALVVPLRAHPVLETFIPSKLYDAMAVGRPAIVAARGEAAQLVREAGCGLAIAPEDGTGLAAAVRSLVADRDRGRALGRAGRGLAGDHARSRQVERLEHVLQLAAERRAMRRICAES
jgi:colanic acid biosynthesis glycosyl transferase WcaI